MSNKENKSVETKTVPRQWRVSNVYHELNSDGTLAKTYYPGVAYTLSDEQVKVLRKLKTVWICCNGPISSRQQAEDCGCK